MAARARTADADTAKKTAPKKPAATNETASPRATAKKAAAKKPAAKKAAASSKAPAKTSETKRAPANKPEATKAPAKKPETKNAAAKPADTKRAAAKPADTKNAAAATAPAPAATPASSSGSPRTKGSASSVSTSDGKVEIPAPRGSSKDGISYTKDFDVKFLRAQREALLLERTRLVGQATTLEDEANALIQEGEMGDVQFDDEGGEGDTMVVERERDLALSAQARQTVVDIDAALQRITEGTYGYSVVSGLPISRERLEAIPWATELVQEKVGGIGRR